jgi:prophage tail gpP-like protein
VISQGPGNDQNNMAKVAHTPFAAEAVKMLGNAGVPAVIVNELPMIDAAHLQGRSGSEGGWQTGDQITVFATVYGWLRPSGGLWYRDQIVNVTSPMLIMEGQPLTAKAVTFTQDDKTGTRTLLELMNAAALGGLKPPIQ